MVCVAYAEENKLSGKKMAGGKQDKLLWSYRQQQPFSGNVSSLPLLVEVRSSGKDYLSLCLV